MKVKRIFRRQWLDTPAAFVREVCQAVGYNGRYLWLVPTKTVYLIGPWSGRNSHIRYRLVRLHPTIQVVPMTNRGHGSIRLENRIIIAVPVLHGRKRSALLFMSPNRINSFEWCKAFNLVALPEEVAVLRNQQNKSHDRATFEVAKALCIHRGLIDPKGDLTDDGRELVTWYDTKHPLPGSYESTEKST